MVKVESEELKELLEKVERVKVEVVGVEGKRVIAKIGRQKKPRGFISFRDQHGRLYAQGDNTTALPCIAFSVREREIIQKYGFLTYPRFLDNFYVRHRTRGFKLFLKLLKQYKDLVEFAVLPDLQYDRMSTLRKAYPDIKWIFPLHKKSELEIAYNLDVEWIGMPHRKQWRDYTIQWLVEHVDGFNLWYLGFWNEKMPWILQWFDGFDTTIPETYSGKFGKIWLTWGKAVKPKKPMKTIEIFEINVRNFRKALKSLEGVRRMKKEKNQVKLSVFL